MNSLAHLFGRTPKTPDDRDFLLAPHVKPLPPIPDHGWGHGGTYADWRMNGNGPVQKGERLPSTWKAAKGGAGNCVHASWVNELKVALTDAGMSPAEAEKVVGNAEVAIRSYMSTGYDPVSGSHDEGDEIRNRLKRTQKVGLKIADGSTRKIGLYVLVDHTKIDHVLFALRYFEALPIGCSVKQGQMDAFNEAEAAGDTPIWTPDDTEEIGLHCIPLVGRPDAEHFAAITWRLRILLTAQFFTEQVDEVWAYLSPDRISKVTGKSYEGASEAVLAEYLTLATKL